jgi:hypothetical protein
VYVKGSLIADLRPKAIVETILHNINNIKEWMEGRLRKYILLQAFPKPYGASPDYTSKRLVKLQLELLIIAYIVHINLINAKFGT